VTFTPFTYAVTVTESGLPTATDWFATVNAATENGTSASLVFQETNGTWAYSIAGAIGFTPTPASGMVTVAGAVQSVPVTEAVWATGGAAISTLYSVYNGRSDLQSEFPQVSSNMANFEGLVSWAGSVVRGGTSDVANTTLAPYAYWYDLMGVYNTRGDLQYAFPAAYTVLANYSALADWAGMVVTGSFSDSAGALLQAYGYYYDLHLVYDQRSDLQAAFPNAFTSASEYTLLLDWAGGVATGSFSDSSSAMLSTYNYWYVLAYVYNGRADLQSAFPSALTSGASWAGLVAWVQNVVNHKFPDSAYATLEPYASEYNAL
jgi:hypothetical protein